MGVRVAFCLNAGPRAGQSQAATVVEPRRAALAQTATNKLRLRKRDLVRLRLFVWGSGTELADAELDGALRDGDVVAVSLGEEYAGPGRAIVHDAHKATGASPPDDDGWRWDARSDALAVVEWKSARPMNAALGRMSTFLEHPSLCAGETSTVVGLSAQRTLPSSAYLGHNLYAHTLAAFEAAAAAADDSDAQLAPAEREFLETWRERGAPAVVISFVAGAESTLRHEMCHARYALVPSYRDACDEEWAALDGASAGRLAKWMRDLGYHGTRHADEFGAYALTEPDAFWRGRLRTDQLAAARAHLKATAELDGSTDEARGAAVTATARTSVPILYRRA